MAERKVIEIQANDLMAYNVTGEESDHDICIPLGGHIIVHSDSRTRKILTVMALHQALQVVIVAVNQAHQASLVTVKNFVNLMYSQSEEVNSYSEEEVFEDQLLEDIQLIPEGLMRELATNTSRIATANHKSTQFLKDMVSDMERLIGKL